jgi:hypothetical protein
MSSGNPVIRRACALAGLLALLLQGTSGGHMLLVEHTRCVEHGELEHGGDGHHHDTGAHASEHAPAFDSASDPASSSAHEHCALTADRRDALVPTGESQACGSIEVARAESAFASPIVVAETPRYQIAPKNSPPA